MTGCWLPEGACRLDGLPRPGMLVAFDHAAWTVTAVASLVLDPAIRGDPDQMTHLVWVRSRTEPRISRRLECHAYFSWWHYPDGRYPVCVRCRCPMPCPGRHPVHHAASRTATLLPVGTGSSGES